jgi:hypothetical protein
MGVNMSTRIKAVTYVECSAKTQENLTDVFEEAFIAYAELK